MSQKSSYEVVDITTTEYEKKLRKNFGIILGMELSQSGITTKMIQGRTGLSHQSINAWMNHGKMPKIASMGELISLGVSFDKIISQAVFQTDRDMNPKIKKYRYRDYDKCS